MYSRYNDGSPHIASVHTSSSISSNYHSPHKRKINPYPNEESYTEFSSPEPSKRHLTPPTQSHPTITSNSESPTTTASPISKNKSKSIPPPPTISPTTLKFLIKAELEDKSNNGLSPPNSNEKTLQNLEVRFTLPTRYSASLYSTPHSSTPTKPRLSTKLRDLKLRLTPPTRDSASLRSTLYSTNSKISSISTKLWNLELQLTHPTRDSSSLRNILYSTNSNIS